MSTIRRFMARARRHFEAIAAQRDEEIDLAEAALWLAAEEYPRLDVETYRERLDQYGDRARRRAERASQPRQFVEALNQTLFTELGFHGNRDNYYDVRNSFLNEVIDRRTGIPISLSLVYMEIGRRVGFDLRGVGLPGHFIAGHFGPAEPIYIDAFNGGRLLDESDCAALVAEMTGGRLTLERSHLAPVTSRQLLTRMLANLLGIYSGSRDYPRAIAAVERILLLNPHSISHLRDHGLLLAAAGRANEAIEALRRYLEITPAAADAEQIRRQLQTLYQARARLN